MERVDPDAVIQTRGSRLVQADAAGENLRVVSDLQSTYPDGRLRLLGHVKVILAERADREGFVLTGDEATLNSDQTRIELTGIVRMKAGDGLRAETEEASYDDSDGIVRMPGPTTFHDVGLNATGERAEYDRRQTVVRLRSSAQVDLVGNGDPTRIRSEAATLARAESYMEFDRDVAVETRTLRMAADGARAVFLEESSELESLELQRNARIVAIEPSPGGLRDLGSDRVRLSYVAGEQGRRLDQAVLIGDAQAAVYSSDGESGSQIYGQSMQLDFFEDGSLRALVAQDEVKLRLPNYDSRDGGFGSEVRGQLVRLEFAADGALRALVARDEVKFRLPDSDSGPSQVVTANKLTATGHGDQGLDSTLFEGNVVYVEVSRTSDGSKGSRRTEADRMEADLAPGLTNLQVARFIGHVRFDDGERVGESDEALYSVESGSVTLLTSEPANRAPRVIDHRGSIQGTTITLQLDGGRIEAVEEVKSVLTKTEGPFMEASGEAVRRPSLLDTNEEVSVVASALVYNRETAVATYSGDARLWQTDTAFAGDEIILNETNGNISATGEVRTRSLVNQIDDVTGLHEDQVTTGEATQFVYDEALHRATYTELARLTGPQIDLRANLITLFLQTDSRTLERIEAIGGVDLLMSGRRVTGESLVYHDADGRYEMEGVPVRMTEEVESGCRDTTGRRLVFFVAKDAFSVNGESEVRTETTITGDCQELGR